MKTNTLARFTIGILILLNMASTVAVGQYYKGCDIDFGYNYLAFIGGVRLSLHLYAKPQRDEPPFALFETGVTDRVLSFSITYLPNATKVLMHDRLLEIYRVDEYGLPVLSFSSASEWVHISLDCREKINPPSAWVKVPDVKKAGLQIKSWTTFFEPDWPVAFHCDSLMVFHSEPDEASRIFPTLVGDSSNPYYCMRVLKTWGPWMQVYLESPSTFMEVDRETRHATYESSNPPPKVWIKYLDDRGRPQIWYLSD